MQPKDVEIPVLPMNPKIHGRNSELSAVAIRKVFEMGLISPYSTDLPP